MNIYFSGSIRGGRQDEERYHQLIEELKRYGKVLTEHVGSSKMEENLTDRQIHDRDLEWLEKADVVVAEVTTPSLGVGYEIGRAGSFGKPIYCLYREQSEKRVSAMILGSPDVTCFKYEDLTEAKEIIGKILK